MHLFSGAGGGILSDILLGHQPVCAVEIDNYCQQVLAERQADGDIPWFPIFGDVKTFDGRPWRGLVDIVAGGFPCQDISIAGAGAGIGGERSGLWSEMARIIGEVRPRFAFVENVPALLTRGLGRLLSDLAALGYDCRWMVLGAADVGAWHKRDRLWIVAADSNRVRELQSERGEQDERRRAGDCGNGDLMRTGFPISWEVAPGKNGIKKWGHSTAKGWWTTEPDVVRVVHGVSNRVDRIKALGNAQVPQCAATAWRILTEGWI